jgi:hypothetical protein
MAGKFWLVQKWRDECRKGRIRDRNRQTVKHLYYYYHHYYYYYYYYYYLTAIELTPGGSSIHLHTNSTHNAEDGTHITVTRKKLGSAGRARSLRVIPWHLNYSWGKCKEKPQLGWSKRSPDIPVAVNEYSILVECDAVSFSRSELL